MRRRYCDLIRTLRPPARCTPGADVTVCAEIAGAVAAHKAANAIAVARGRGRRARIIELTHVHYEVAGRSGNNSAIACTRTCQRIRAGDREVHGDCHLRTART